MKTDPDLLHEQVAVAVYAQIVAAQGISRETAVLAWKAADRFMEAREAREAPKPPPSSISPIPRFLRVN